MEGNKEQTAGKYTQLKVRINGEQCVDIHSQRWEDIENKVQISTAKNGWNWITMYRLLLKIGGDKSILWGILGV